MKTIFKFNNLTPKKTLILLIIFTLISIFFITRFGSGWNTFFNDSIGDIIFTILGLILMSFSVASIGVFCVDKILLSIINLFIKKAPNENRVHFQSIIDDLFKRILKAHTVATKALLKAIGDLAPDKMGSFIGIPLYEVLYGYQLTCLIGFSSTEKLIKITDFFEFKKELLKRIETETGLSIRQIELYNESFLKCAGDMKCLSNKFLSHVVNLCKLDKKIIDQNKAIKIFNELSVTIAIQTQRNTARAFGNMKIVKELDKVFENYIEELEKEDSKTQT